MIKEIELRDFVIPGNATIKCNGPTNKANKEVYYVYRLKGC